MKLAGVVTLYHPDKKVIKNILTYINQLDVLYVLDNTENPKIGIKKYFSEIPKTNYVAFGDNLGVAYAYNYALEKAAKKYDFLLIMDQDSSFLGDMMSQYVKCIEGYENTNSKKVGIYCVNHDQEIDLVENIPRKITYAISSGSVISTDIASRIGGFDNNLFIDEVDGEFCYRIANYGKDIIEFPFILLQHAIGHKTCHVILGKRFNTSNHPAIRKYYIIRNKIYVSKKYPKIRKQYAMDIVKIIVKVILVEKNKIEKLKYILVGGVHGIINHMGRYHG